MDKALDKGLAKALKEALKEIVYLNFRGEAVSRKDLYKENEIAMKDFIDGFKSGYCAAKRESRGKEFTKKLNKLRKTLGQREIDV